MQAVDFGRGEIHEAFIALSLRDWLAGEVTEQQQPKVLKIPTKDRQDKRKDALGTLNI